MTHVDTYHVGHGYRSHWNGLPIDRLPLAYIEFDRDVRILEWNPAAERIFGYSRDEAIGRVAMELLLPGSPSEHILNIVNRIWAGDFDAHSVNENRTKDNRIIECFWFNTPLLNSEGTVTGGVAFGRQITATCVPNLGGTGHIRENDILRMQRLTPRQIEVLRLVVTGHRTKEIADILDVCAKTVEMHRTGLMNTLDIHDIAGLVRFAIRVGLITADDQA